MDHNSTPTSSGPSGAPFEGSIFWNPNEAVDLIEMPLPLITEGTQDMGDGVYWLRAGTPLDEYFAVANDEDAKYVVAEDFYFISTKPDQAKVVPLITSGYVDINKAEKAAGITYSQDCIDALADFGIVLVDGTLPSSGGGGGGALVVKLTTPDNRNFTADKTMGEIFEAAKNGSVVFTWDITDSSMPGIVSTQISQIVQILETGQAYVLCVAMPVSDLSQEATSMVKFDLLPMQAATLDAYPTGTVQHPPA